MADEKDTTSPAITSGAYDAMLPSWIKIQTVLDGTEALRAAGQGYLPQHEAEADEAYSERLSRCTLFNLTKITLNSWVGRPFSDPLAFTEVPSEIENDVLSDVDLLGNNIHVFARNWYSDGLAKGYSHVLVDYPRVRQEGDMPRTIADDEREGLRPYWIHVRPEQLFFADAEVVNGHERLREIRIMEQITEREGFGERVVPQIRRVFMDEAHDPPVGTVELYRQREKKKKEEEWYVFDRYTFSLDRIPLVTYYADRSAFMQATSPLEDLADLNIAHWQSTSDQRAILTVARFPMLALSGGTDESGKKVIIGPYRILYCADPQGRFYYVEHGGAAIAAGRQDLEDLINQMAEYGADFLKKRSGDVTATARALDSAEATSPLQDATLRFQDAMNQALYFTALWLKMDDGGEVMVSRDFGPESPDTGELSILQTARREKDISRKAFLMELKRRAVLPDEFDPDEDAAQLELEAMNMFGETLPDEEPTPPEAVAAVEQE